MSIEQLKIAAARALAELRSAIIEPVEIPVTDNLTLEVRPPEDGDRVNVCHRQLGWVSVKYSAEGVVVDILPHEGIDPVESAAAAAFELAADDR